MEGFLDSGITLGSSYFSSTSFIRHVVIRTLNKKYFKKLSIPDLDRFSLPYLPQSVSFAHANNTLIVSYDKPVEILKFEEGLRNEIKKMKGMEEGDVEPCHQS